MEKRERRLTEIGDEIFSSSGNGLDAKLKEIEDFVMRRLGDIHGLLTGDVQRAKSELAKHCAEITLTPEGQTYQVSGDWNLLGERSDGAGGQTTTILPQAMFFVDLAAFCLSACFSKAPYVEPSLNRHLEGLRFAEATR